MLQYIEIAPGYKETWSNSGGIHRQNGTVMATWARQRFMRRQGSKRVRQNSVI
jgi:hypothetical protein